MKTNPVKSSLLILLIVLMAGCLFRARAVPATYQVDMTVQETLGNFDPANGDRVIVSGTFTSNNWSTTSYLSPSVSNSNIYVGTFDGVQSPGSYEDHKFIIDVGGLGTTLNWESIPNRWFQVPSTATNLPVVFFNDVTNAVPVTNAITFTVDMSVQMALGNFNPAGGDSVYVAGDAINNWTPGVSVLSQDPNNTNLWVGTFNVSDTVGATVNYKFIMNTFAGGSQWESDGVGPGGAQNRQFVFPGIDTNLPAVFFNNISNAAAFVVTPVTFTLNTAVQAALGNFDPSSGTVSVAGDALNNWSAIASLLTQTSTNANLWVGTFDVTNTVGATVNYKFVLNGGGTWENNGVGPGGAQNRQFTFTNAPTAPAEAFFNNVADLGRLSVSNLSGGQLQLNWTAGPYVRLQAAGSLTGSWQDVPGTQGQSSALTNVESGPVFFRLIGP